MTTLVDWQIQELAINSKMIEPFNPEQLNPASYDVRLGQNLYIERSDGSLLKRKMSYLMDPGEWVLSEIKEKLLLPRNIKAEFVLKSSRGREGYQHAMSGYIDPGYMGIITLEIKNMRRYVALPLNEDLLIGQIVFSKTDDTCHSPYGDSGHYYGDMEVTPSRTSPQRGIVTGMPS